MHTQKEGLHPGAARKEAIARSRTTLTMTPETKGVLRRMGNGSMSDGVYLATQIVTQLLKRKIIKIEFEKHGLSYRLHSGEKLAESPRSGRDEAQQLHRASADKLFLDPKVNPYAGRVLNKKQLLDTGHFTHRMMRATLPGQKVTDKYGYWWYRADNPDSPRCLQRGLRNDSGRLMATYIGLESEWDDWEKYSEGMGRL